MTMTSSSKGLFTQKAADSDSIKIAFIADINNFQELRLSLALHGQALGSKPILDINTLFNSNLNCENCEKDKNTKRG